MQNLIPNFFKTEISEIAHIASPIAFAQLCQMAMGVTDTVLLGGVSEQALAIGGLTTSLFFTICIIFQSALNSSGILMAQSVGGERFADIPKIYWTTYIFGILLCVPCFFVLSQTDYILRWMGEEEEIVQQASHFMQILIWGMPPLLVGAGLVRVVLPALNASHILLQITPIITILNGLLNAAFIYGLWFFPKMGLNGSAVGTTISLWIASFVLIGVTHSKQRLKKFICPVQPQLTFLGPLIKLGIPIAISTAAELLLFTVTSLRAGLFGTSALAAHQIANSVAAFTFMIPLAIAQAANVRVGFWIGAKKVLRARQSGFLAIGLGGGIMGIVGSIMFLFPQFIVGMFLDIHNPANHITLEISSALLEIVALFQIVDGLQSVANGSLRGLKDANIPMIISVFSYWGIGFFAGGWLAFNDGWQVPGLWLGLALGLTLVAILLTGRFIWLTRTPRHMLRMISK